MAARGLDRLDITSLLWRQRVAVEQVGHAQDAGHGRPDLVAHGCQELPLGPFAGFGPGLVRPGRHHGGPQGRDLVVQLRTQPAGTDGHHQQQPGREPDPGPPRLQDGRDRHAGDDLQAEIRQLGGCRQMVGDHVQFALQPTRAGGGAQERRSFRLHALVRPMSRVQRIEAAGTIDQRHGLLGSAGELGERAGKQPPIRHDNHYPGKLAGRGAKRPADRHDALARRKSGHDRGLDDHAGAGRLKMAAKIIPVADVDTDPVWLRCKADDALGIEDSELVECIELVEAFCLAAQKGKDASQIPLPAAESFDRQRYHQIERAEAPLQGVRRRPADGPQVPARLIELGSPIMQQKGRAQRHADDAGSQAGQQPDGAGSQLWPAIRPPGAKR